MVFLKYWEDFWFLELFNAETFFSFLIFENVFDQNEDFMLKRKSFTCNPIHLVTNDLLRPHRLEA